MKKTMMIAALFAASTLAASAADVYSSNIVGYTKLSLGSGLSIIGAQFEAVGGGGLDIQNITSEDLTGGDIVKFWTGSGYTTVFYYGEENDGGVYEDDSYEVCLGPGWGDINQIAVSLPIDTGEGFWLQAGGASDVTISGQVGSTNEVSVASGLTLVVNPYPTGIDIAEIQADGLTGGDIAKFWTGSGYSTVFYYGEENDGGVYEDDSYEVCLGPGWGDINQIAVSSAIAVGEGFWVQAGSAATLTFPDPLAE